MNPGIREQGSGVTFSRDEIAPVFRVSPGPVLITDHAFCECGRLARHGVFCERCWDEYSSLERQHRESEARRGATSHAREMWRRRFVGSLFVMLIGEGLWNTAINVPVNLRSTGTALLWAVLVALIAASLGAMKKQTAQRVIANVLAIAQTVGVLIICTVLVYWIWTGGK